MEHAAATRTLTLLVSRAKVAASLSLILVLLGGGLTLSVARPEDASAQGGYQPPGYRTPEFSAKAGERLDGAGVLVEGNCTNIRDVVIHWGDGTSTPPTSQTPEGSGVRITGSHVYGTRGDFLGAVDLTATCTNNQGQEYTARAYGKPGGYPLGFIVHVGPGTCRGSQTASGALMPSPFARTSQAPACDVKKRFSPEDKVVLAKAKAYYAGQILVCLATAHFVPHPVVKGAALGCELGAGVAIAYLEYLLDTDPPDSNFRRIAKPSHSHLKHVRPNRRLSRRGARTLNRLLDSYSRATNLRGVFRVTIERASGAFNQGNVRFERIQMLKSADYAEQLARVLDRTGKQSRAAVRVLRRAGAKVRVTRRQAARFKSEVARHGLPRGLVRGLKRMGSRQSDLRALKRVILSQPALQATGRFPNVLAGSASSAEADAMRLFAKRVRANPTAEAR
jgi:hypothetical protein